MIGPPGSGKTMLAERLVGCAPADIGRALAVTRIHSAAGRALPEGALLERPPFRAPHHQSSIVSLIGGGTWSLRPGEVSLATSKVRECTQTWRQLHQAGVYGQSTLATFARESETRAAVPMDVAQREPWHWAGNTGRLRAATLADMGCRRMGCGLWDSPQVGVGWRSGPLRERQQHRPWDRKRRATKPAKWDISTLVRAPGGGHRSVQDRQLWPSILGGGGSAEPPTWPSIDPRNISP